MSKITLSGNPSGSGNFTIAAPNGNTDRTLTLPDATGTLIPGTIDGSGNVAFAGGVYLGGSGSANLLDDYEEGTWTPTVSISGAGTFTTADATYTKIGRMVYVSLTVNFSGASGTPTINGLPFSADSIGIVSGREDATSGYSVYGRTSLGTTNFVIWYSGAIANATAFQVSGGNFRINLTYLAA